MEEKFDDPEIQEWIDNYDVKVDVQACVDYTEQLTQVITKQLILSTCKKIAALQAIESANSVLKYHLNTPVTIDPKDLMEEIERVSEIEMKSLAISTSNLTLETKKAILEKYISDLNNNVKTKEKKTKETIMLEMLKGEIGKINEELSEKANRDINRVEKRNRK